MPRAKIFIWLCANKTNHLSPGGSGSAMHGMVKLGEIALRLRRHGRIAGYDGENTHFLWRWRITQLDSGDRHDENVHPDTEGRIPRRRVDGVHPFIPGIRKDAPTRPRPPVPAIYRRCRQTRSRQGVAMVENPSAAMIRSGAIGARSGLRETAAGRRQRNR